MTEFRGQPLLVPLHHGVRPVAPRHQPRKVIKRYYHFWHCLYDRSEDTAEFLQQFGNPFQAVGMIDGRNGIRWGFCVPETYLLDRNGVVVLGMLAL